MDFVRLQRNSKQSPLQLIQMQFCHTKYKCIVMITSND